MGTIRRFSCLLGLYVARHFIFQDPARRFSFTWTATLRNHACFFLKLSLHTEKVIRNLSPSIPFADWIATFTAFTNFHSLLFYYRQKSKSHLIRCHPPPISQLHFSFLFCSQSRYLRFCSLIIFHLPCTKVFSNREFQLLWLEIWISPFSLFFCATHRFLLLTSYL